MSETVEKNVLVPKVRFPGFQAFWEIRKLNDLAEVNPRASAELPTTFNYIDLESVEKGKLLGTRVEHRATAPSRAQRVVAKDEILFQTVRPYQKNNLLFSPIDQNIYVSSTGYAQLRAEGCPAFLCYLIETAPFQSAVQKRCSGSNYPAIAPSDLATITTVAPTEMEQRKIADCLQSLDELIAAQTEKLEALKRHKKGLLQQLFPAEGETTPRLRFPQFLANAPWRIEKLNSISQLRAAGDLDVSRFSRVKTNEHVHPIYSNGIEEEGLYGYSSRADALPLSVTITARGTLGVAFLRETAFSAIGRLLIVESSDRLDPRFLVEAWNHVVNIPSEVTSIPQLTAITARSVEIPLPSIDEQQEIAGTLSTISYVIKRIDEELITLRTHKAGLMQQLFPNVEELDQ